MTREQLQTLADVLCHDHHFSQAIMRQDSNLVEITSPAGAKIELLLLPMTGRFSDLKYLLARIAGVEGAIRSWSLLGPNSTVAPESVAVAIKLLTEPSSHYCY